MHTTDRHSSLRRETRRPRTSWYQKKVGPRPSDILALPLRLAATALLIAVAWIHVHLWQSGYKHIPTVGPLFLVAALTASVVAVALLARPRRVLAAFALAVDAGILLALIGSINVGLFGFTEALNAPFVIESIVIETLAALALTLWIAVDRITHDRYEPVNLADTGGHLTGNVTRTPFCRAGTDGAINRIDAPLPSAVGGAPDGRRVAAVPPGDAQ